MVYVVFMDPVMRVLFTEKALLKVPNNPNGTGAVLLEQFPVSEVSVYLNTYAVHFCCVCVPISHVYQKLEMGGLVCLVVRFNPSGI